MFDDGIWWMQSMEYSVIGMCVADLQCDDQQKLYDVLVVILKCEDKYPETHYIKDQPPPTSTKKTTTKTTTTTTTRQWLF